MPSNRKKSLGRDPFDDDGKKGSSGSVERLIKGRSPGAPEPREVVVNVRLTPSNIKHLDAIRVRLEERGRKGMTRDELIRIAIALLSAEDVS